MNKPIKISFIVAFVYFLYVIVGKFTVNGLDDKEKLAVDFASYCQEDKATLKECVGFYNKTIPFVNKFNKSEWGFSYGPTKEGYFAKYDELKRDIKDIAGDKLVLLDLKK